MFIVQNCYFGCPDQVFFFCAPDATRSSLSHLYIEYLPILDLMRVFS